MKKTIQVFAPATVANVACGFDILGFAVDSPGDSVKVTLTEGNGVTIVKVTGDEGKLSLEAEKNTAGVSVLAFLKEFAVRKGNPQQLPGVEIELHKKLPLGSGMGSSASSAVASVFALNELLGRPFTPEEMIPFTMESERVASGAAHADNVAPGMLGGFVLIRSYEPLDVVRIPCPENLFCSLVHPHVEIKTSDARKILRQQISLKDAIVQWGNTAGLIAGLMKQDFPLIGRSLQDVIIEPVRSMLIPGFEEAKREAMSAGALGCSISGSGPTIFALSDSKGKADHIAQKVADVFHSLKLETDVYVSAVNQTGPRII